MASLTPPRSRRLATLLLIGVTAVWGSTFFLIRDVVQQLAPTDFLAIRFSVGALAMALVFWRQLRALDHRQLQLGILLGVLYGLAQILQTVGLAHTEAARSGFITGTYVVLTPVFAAVLLRERISLPTWCAVALATAGLAVLSLQGFGVGYGEALTLAAAAVYALHIICLGRFSTVDSVAGLAALQMIVIAVVCTLGATPGGIDLPTGGRAWASVLYMALIAGAVAIWAQTWAQARLAATRAAIVMTLEPVFAAVFAVLFGGESLTGRMLVGGALVLTAMYLVELLGRHDGDRTAEQDPPAELLHHEV